MTLLKIRIFTPFLYCQFEHSKKVDNYVVFAPEEVQLPGK